MRINDLFIQQMTEELLDLCREEFSLENIPPIKFSTKNDSIDGSSFGSFDGESIVVIIKNRHPMDVMRSLSHELVHWHQQKSGQKLNGSTGSFTENQANAIAGIIMRKFAKKYPEYFDNN